MRLAEQINVIVEQMPEKKQAVLLELVKTMIDPDELLSDDDIKALDEADAEYERGECVRLEDIDLNRD